MPPTPYFWAIAPVPEVHMSVIDHHPSMPWSLPLTEAGIAVVPWTDPVIDRLGAAVRSRYVERFWLPVLGPTCTWVMRYIDLRLEESPTGVILDLAETARAVGVPTNSPHKGSLIRAMNRCVMFGLAQPVGTVLAVRRFVPLLPRKHLEQLTPTHRRAHRRWLSERDALRRAV